MNDRNELSLLVSRLGRWLDEKSPGDGRALFTEDAEVHTLGGVSKGVDALVEQARRNHQVPTQANLLVVFVKDEGLRLLGERYELRAARTGDGWRLTRVQARPIWEVAGV